MLDKQILFFDGIAHLVQLLLRNDIVVLGEQEPEEALTAKQAQ
jgi:hypothetical protein